jgi:hypothetical protein
MSDGMESDAEGNIYFGGDELIRRRFPDGSYELLPHDPRILWPVHILSGDKRVFSISQRNQLHRQPGFHYVWIRDRSRVRSFPAQGERNADLQPATNRSPLRLESALARTETVCRRSNPSSSVLSAPARQYPSDQSARRWVEPITQTHWPDHGRGCSSGRSGGLSGPLSARDRRL